MRLHNDKAERKATAGLLPGVSYFLGIPYAPARKLIDAQVPVIIATDFNPGSSMSENMQMMMSLASTQMKMSAEEIITSVTINPAYSLGLEDRIGSIEPGKQADILIFDIPSYKYIIYNFGVNNLECVIKKGGRSGSASSHRLLIPEHEQDHLNNTAVTDCRKQQLLQEGKSSGNKCHNIRRAEGSG